MEDTLFVMGYTEVNTNLSLTALLHGESPSPMPHPHPQLWQLSDRSNSLITGLFHGIPLAMSPPGTFFPL
jgi:hypothetical protein